MLCSVEHLTERGLGGRRGEGDWDGEGGWDDMHYVTLCTSSRRWHHCEEEAEAETATGAMIYLPPLIWSGPSQKRDCQHHGPSLVHQRCVRLDDVN